MIGTVAPDVLHDESCEGFTVAFELECVREIVDELRGGETGLVHVFDQLIEVAEDSGLTVTETLDRIVVGPLLGL